MNSSDTFMRCPRQRTAKGQEVAAVRGVLGSLLGMMRSGETYIGVATDHVIESFRNAMWPGYKTGQGVDPALLSQFALLEEALRALGVVVWAMEEYKADDALASAAFQAAQDKRVERVVISTPDKDLAQCVQGTRVVQLDRRRRVERDHQGVIDKFGVEPASIPDYLALVGDAADGYPGLPGWGARSAAAVLSRFSRLDAIPADARDWHVNVFKSGKPIADFRQESRTGLSLSRSRNLANGSPAPFFHWRPPLAGPYLSLYIDGGTFGQG